MAPSIKYVREHEAERAGGMTGALDERKQRALCRISEAACVRPGR
jgi:hypothetical protein